MSKHKSKRLKIALVVAAVLVVALGIWFAVQARSSSSKKASTRSVTKEEAKEADKLTKPTETTNASGDVTPSAETSINNLAIIISRPVDGDTIPLSEGIEMRVTVSGSSSKTGSCTVVATGPSGQKVTKSADFVAQSSYSSCALDIPASQLSTGTWTTSLTATSGGATSKAITQKVTLQ